jgi:hypothetical protein
MLNGELSLEQLAHLRGDAFDIERRTAGGLSGTRRSCRWSGGRGEFSGG